ncbi:MAG: hypothetical protein ACFE91_11085, partial [Promethearchaeota archaeon]
MKKKDKKIILVIVIVLSLSIGFFNFGRNHKNPIDNPSVISADSANNPFICGAKYLAFTIDPQDCWDGASLDVIIQVTETLFAYDYNDPLMPKVPR